jgi:hypothetical protein
MAGAENVVDFGARVRPAVPPISVEAPTADGGTTSRLLRTPEEYLGHVRQVFGRATFEGVVQYGREDPGYALRFSDVGLVRVGPSLGDLRTITAALAAAGIDLPFLTPKRWHAVFQCLVRLAELSDEPDPRLVEFKDYLAEYAEDAATIGLHETEELLYVLGVTPMSDYSSYGERGKTFWDADGRLYLSPSRLRRWLAGHQGERLTPKELRRLLDRLGFTAPPGRNAQGVLAAKHPRTGKTVSHRYLASPPGFDPNE